jgi:hypothetical protein
MKMRLHLLVKLCFATHRMRLRHVRIAPIDEHHCLAHVAWTAIYERGGESSISIDFEVHYLVQQLEMHSRSLDGCWGMSKPRKHV